MSNLFNASIPTVAQLKSEINPEEFFQCRIDYDDLVGFTAKSITENRCIIVLILRMLEVAFREMSAEEAAEIVKESWLMQLLPRERRYIFWETHYLPKRHKILQLAFSEEEQDVYGMSSQDFSKKVMSSDVFRFNCLDLPKHVEEDKLEDQEALKKSKAILIELYDNALAAFCS